MAVTRSTLRATIDDQGYVIIPGLVPRANLDAVVADIWWHAGAAPDERESWYKPGIVAPTGMVEMYHYQSMWNNRQVPQLHEVFAEVHGTGRLWVSLDRVNLKPPADPAHPEHDHKGFIHWDTDTSVYPRIPFRVQGVLALTDTDAEMGGFQCVPGLFRELDAWMARQPAGRDPRHPDLDGYTVEKIAMRAGDLVIWSTLLAHGNGHNISDRVRLAQYITMNPADEADEAARQARIHCWRNRLPPPGRAFKGDPRRIEEQVGTPPDLTALGRTLLGLDRWA